MSGIKRIATSGIFLVCILVALGLATRLIGLSHPSQVVFDEVHFGKFMSAYFTHQYYFDIHPPLGKLLIAAGAWLGGYGNYVVRFGAFDFTSISEAYPLGISFIWFRLLPALAGAFIPVAVYWFVRELGVKKWIALCVGLSLVFENALTVQSRLMLLDAFLLCFGFLGLAMFFRARNNRYAWRWLMPAGILFALSFSIKWTGLAFMGLAGLVWLIDMICMRREPGWFGRLVRGKICFIALPLVVYFSIFAIHFLLLSAHGPGDAYMSVDFWHKNTVQKFVDLNQKMLYYNSTLTATHPYGSSAWTWPLMMRPVYYWVGAGNAGTSSRIYLLGNPLVWYTGFVGIVSACAMFVAGRMNKAKQYLCGVLFAGYVMNFAPFLSVSRVLFLYHYFAAMIFSVVMLWVVLDGVVEHMPVARRVAVCAGLMVAMMMGFAFFAPLSYGLPLSESAYHMRIWLPSWI